MTGADYAYESMTYQSVAGTGPLSSKAASGEISSPTCSNLVASYLNECEMRLQSPKTVETRKVFLRNLQWFLYKRNCPVCGVSELRQFFHYLMHGHKEPGGRFGKPYLNKPVRPITLKDYYICYRSFFDWLVEVGEIQQNPLAHIPRPRVREEEQAALPLDQVNALLQAAQESADSTRNLAILSFLLDTGCRASELISVQLDDLDITNRCCPVIGKGNKQRMLYFGANTAYALQKYMSETIPARAQHTTESSGCLFVSSYHYRPLTRSGLLQLLERLGKKAGIKASVSPHALRRTFAVQTLKNGANVFSVQAMLGHSSLRMTQKYCRLAQTDVETQHRQFSPMDRFNREWI